MKQFLKLFFVLAAFSLNSLLAQKTVKVGIMLPFKDFAGVESPRAIDFYRGLVMAMDTLKKDGTSFRVYAYNTANTSINTILNDSIIPYLDVIFGPDDRITLKTISDFTSQHGTKVVNAFSPTCEAMNNNPNFYVAFSPDQIVSESAAALFKLQFQESKPNVIILDTKKTVHPFVVEIKKAAKKVRFLQAGFTTHQLESRLNKGKPNFIVISSADKESASDYAMQIASFKQAYPQYDIRLIGYPEWESYKTALGDALNRCDTYIFTPYYNNVNAPRNQHFIKTYNKFFKKEMDKQNPVMAMFGFDCGYFMLKALARYGKAYAGEDVYAAPLQSAFSFKPYGNSGGMVNQYVRFVHYKTDGKTELIDKK